MAEDTGTSDFERFVEILDAHAVEFVVIGGQAEALLGSTRVTYDTDLCYRRTPENLERLAAALRQIRPSLRGAPPDLPFRLDAQSLALGTNFTFSTPHGDLDLLGWVEPLGEYENVARNATAMDLDGRRILVIALDDLIRIKQHIGRPKDRESLFHLLALRELRNERDAGG